MPTVYGCLGDGISGCSFADFLSVGSKPAGSGRWGNSDLAGSEIEWSLDVFAERRTDSGGDPCVDSARLSSGSTRVFRSGAFNSAAAALVVTGKRNSSEPINRHRTVGFRCAGNP